MSILITEVEKAGIRDGETEAREVRWLPQSHRELEFESSVQTLCDNALSSMPLFLLLVTKGNGVGGCSIDTVIDIRSNVFGESVGFLHLWFLGLIVPCYVRVAVDNKQKFCCLIFLFLNIMNHFTREFLISQHVRAAHLVWPFNWRRRREPRVSNPVHRPLFNEILTLFWGKDNIINVLSSNLKKQTSMA